MIEGNSWKDVKIKLADEKKIQESWHKVQNAILSPDEYVFNVIRSALHIANKKN